MRGTSTPTPSRGKVRQERYRPGILVDHEIIKAQRSGLIKIDPFSEEYVEPATYDLGVGEKAVISTTSKVIDLQNSRLLVVEPGAMAMIQSLEILELSRRVAGRVGPKTSLLRRGVFVATGPQIDPGFKGRLTINLINLSPRPFPLHFEDRILTTEFHFLPSIPTKGYEGPHQGKTEFGTEEIEILLAYRGPTLADLHRGFAEMRDNIRQIAELGREIPRFWESQEGMLLRMAEISSGLQAPRASPSVGMFVPITSFAPEPYELRKQLIVTIKPLEEGWEASFFDANIHATGDTEEEALRNLKSLILDVLDSLSGAPRDSLEIEPRRQLAVLTEFIAKSV